MNWSRSKRKNVIYRYKTIQLSILKSYLLIYSAAFYYINAYPFSILAKYEILLNFACIDDILRNLVFAKIIHSFLFPRKSLSCIRCRKIFSKKKQRICSCLTHLFADTIVKINILVKTLAKTKNFCKRCQNLN